MMNRSQRRKMEKELGITKHRQGMNHANRMKNLQENIQTGKERDREMQEKIKRQKNEEADKAAQHELSSLATTIMLRDGLSWYESIEAAKVEIEKSHVIKSEAA